MMIQALSGDEIQTRGITTLQDLSKHIGSLQVTADGIGSNEIVFRGVSTGGGFLQDATYRTEWLVGPATETDVRYRATQVLRVDLGDADEEPRQGTVIVNVQSYPQRTQVLETSVVSQQWYFDDRAWWVEPGQERGVAH